MELQHVNVKIYFDGDPQVDSEQFIETFHRWVAEQTTDELLIDVADYRHVPASPGVVLVGHEADYAIDNSGNRRGLLYNRKAPYEGRNMDRLRQAFSAAAKACESLEAEFSDEVGLKFNRQEFEIVINDRAMAPNSKSTLAACRPDIESFLKSTLGLDNFHLERHRDDPRCRFGVVVRADQPFDFTVPAD